MLFLECQYSRDRNTSLFNLKNLNKLTKMLDRFLPEHEHIPFPQQSFILMSYIFTLEKCFIDYCIIFSALEYCYKFKGFLKCPIILRLYILTKVWAGDVA
jgi:hypothetical protein